MIHWDKLYNTFNTGDIILFQGEYSLLSYFIEFFTESKWSHIGIVLKDPTYIDPKLKGLYLWNCGYEDIRESENNENILGVQIIPLMEIIEIYTGHVYHRRFTKNIDINAIKNIHKKLHHDPYNIHPNDLMHLLLHKPINHTPNRFVCSTFVAFVLQKLNILTFEPNWCSYIPKDFANNNLNDYSPLTKLK